MPTPIMPALTSAPWLGFPGLAWDVTKTPIFKTKTRLTVSGRESRNSYYSEPLWKFHFIFNLVRDLMSVPRNATRTAPFNEFETLLGFFCQRYGMSEPFFIIDPTDRRVEDQTIMASTSAGVTDYPLVRTFGGFTAPVGGVNEVAADREVRLNGTPTVAYAMNVPFDGWIRFLDAPDPGTEITADFDYYFKVRFDKDSIDFRTDLVDYWEARTVDLMTVRP